MTYYRHKYFRIRKTTFNNGTYFFTVEAANYWFEKVFNNWISYTLQHKNIADAKEHIEWLKNRCIKRDECVFKTK